jgi:hypothetical protein
MAHLFNEIFAILAIKSVDFGQMSIGHWTSLKCTPNRGLKCYKVAYLVLKL